MRHKDLQEILITGKTFDPPGSPKKQPPAGGRSEKRHKYAVSPRDERTVDGLTFASKREMRAFLALQMAEKAGAIRDLKMQVTFKWDTVYRANGQEYIQSPPFYYKADFTYTDVATGEFCVIDAKGCKTPEYRRKRKIMRALFGIEIMEM